MKITKVVARHLQCDMGDRVWNAQQRWTKKNVVVIFIETDTQHIGLGECWVAGASYQALLATINDDVAPMVVGKSPFYVQQIWDEVFKTTALSSRRGITSAALSGVDTALWDLMGKQSGTPLFQLLGASRDRVPCYASAGLYGKDKGLPELFEEMKGYCERGFVDVKIKVGGVTLAEDVLRVQTSREAIGPEGRLMVDANYMLSVPDAIKMAKAFEPYDITWLEAPVHPDDVAGQAEVNRKSPIPVCGNETEFGVQPFKRLIDTRAVEFVQADIAACGGITEARRIAAVASANFLPTTLHAPSTAILFAASLHVAASLPMFDSLEYHMMHQWLRSSFPNADFGVEAGGFVRPPSGPGIGLELSPEDIGDELVA